MTKWLLAICAVLMTAGWGHAGAISLENSSFESPACGGWTQITPGELPGWTSSTWGYAAIFPGTVNSTDGNQCLYLAGENQDLTQTVANVGQPGATYTFLVDARANAATDKLIMEIGIPGTSEGVTRTVQLTQGEWLTCVLTWTAPETVSSDSTIQIRLRGDDTDVDIDNVRLMMQGVATGEEPTYSMMPRYRPGRKGAALEMNYRPSHRSRFIALDNRPGPLISRKHGTVTFAFYHNDPIHTWESLFDFRAGYSREFTEDILKAKGGISACLMPVHGTEGETFTPWGDSDLTHYENAKLEVAVETIYGKTTVRTPVLENFHWYQVAVTWQNGVVKLYLDGVLAGSATIPGGVVELEMANNLMVASNVYGECMLKGFIDEFLLLNRVLTVGEIQAQAAGTVDLSQDSAMTAYLSFDGTMEVKTNRLPDDTLVNDNMIFFADLGDWRYRPVGEIPMSLSVPPGAATNYNCTVKIKKFYTDEIVFYQTKSVTSSATAVTSQAFTTQIDECGVYRLEVTVRNSNNAIVMTRSRDFGLTVDVPSLSEISDSYPVAVHTSQMPRVIPCAADLGFKWTRTWDSIRCPWSELNPDRGVFYWDWMDQSVDSLLAEGHEILFCVQGTPDWAKPILTFEELLQKRMTYSNETAGIAMHSVRWVAEMAPPTDMQGWEDYLRELFRRYRGRIKAYELWNEPGCPNYWGSASTYVQMLQIMYQVAGEEDPDALVVGGAGDPGFVNWTQSIVSGGAAPFMDVLSGHNYIYDSPIAWFTNEHRITQACNILGNATGNPTRFWSTENGVAMLERNEGVKPLTQSQFVSQYGSETISMYAITGTYEEQSAWWDIQSVFTNLLEGAEKHVFHGAGWIDAPNLKGVAFAALTQVLGDYDSIENMNLQRDETIGVWISTRSEQKYAVLFSNDPGTVNFENITYPVQAMDMLGNRYTLTPSDGTLTVDVGPAPVYLFNLLEDSRVPGDANGDGMVDVGDLGILAANYGGTDKTWEQGDFNGDGAVDVGDLGILAANYGTGASGANWDADYVKVFGETTPEDTGESETSLCGTLGLPLVAGCVLMGLMLVKLEK